MPLIKLNRINKGGEIVINSEHIQFVEIEGKSTTVQLGPGLLFSVEESPVAISDKVEQMETDRIKHALIQTGIGKLSNNPL